MAYLRSEILLLFLHSPRQQGAWKDFPGFWLWIWLFLARPVRNWQMFENHVWLAFHLCSPNVAQEASWSKKGRHYTSTRIPPPAQSLAQPSPPGSLQPCCSPAGLWEVSQWLLKNLQLLAAWQRCAQQGLLIPLWVRSNFTTCTPRVLIWMTVCDICSCFSHLEPEPEGVPLVADKENFISLLSLWSAPVFVTNPLTSHIFHPPV